MRLAARPAFRSTRAYARASLKISREKVSQLRYSPRAWANQLDHVTLTLGGWPWPPMRFGSPSFPSNLAPQHRMGGLQRCTDAFAIAPHAVQDRSLGPDACIHAFALTPVLRD